MSAGEQGLRAWARLFGERVTTQADNLRPSRGVDKGGLPAPAAYLAQHGLLRSKPRGDWVSIRCPAHKSGSETHASMRVSLVDGHFFCHACGAKGGDVIALHRLVTGMGFRDAVRDLGGRFHD